jgi:hypothetical protein
MSLVRIDWNPAARTLRQFGLIGVVAFSALAALVHYRLAVFAGLPEGAIRPTSLSLLGCAACCGLLAPLAPRGLKPLYLLMTLIGAPIGLVVTTVVMLMVYYVVITPIAVVFKVIGRDAMHRRFDASAPTYWIRRRPPESTRRYFRQF